MPCQKQMLRQIEGEVQYKPMEVQRLSFASKYFIFYKKFVSA